MREVLSAERQLYILNRVNSNGKITITELIKELGVSKETIRRDLTTLAREAKLKKVHGGALKIKRNLFEEKYISRISDNHDKKVVCGKIAAEYIKDNDTIAVDCGTTAVEVVRALTNKQNLTVITNSVKVLNALIEKVEAGEITARVIFLGGYVDIEHYNTEGFLVEKQLQDIYVDKLFFGATALSENGIMAYDPNEGCISSLYLKHTNQSFLLVDQTKFGENSVYKIAELWEVDYIITDDKDKVSKRIKNICTEHNVQIISK